MSWIWILLLKRNGKADQRDEKGEGDDEVSSVRLLISVSSCFTVRIIRINGSLDVFMCKTQGPGLRLENV